MHRSRVALGLVLVAGLLLSASSPDAGLDRRLVVTLADGPTVDGGRSVLVPGAVLPIDLAIANPYARPVRVTRLTVTVEGVSGLEPGTAAACGTADFGTTSGAVGALLVPPRSVRSLAQAEVPAGRWPSVSMTDADHDQDGCRHVSVELGLRVWGRLA